MLAIEGSVDIAALEAIALLDKSVVLICCAYSWGPTILILPGALVPLRIWAKYINILSLQNILNIIPFTGVY